MSIFKIYNSPMRSDWASLSVRNTPNDEQITQRVEHIIGEVSKGGDVALRRIVEQIEGSAPSCFEVSVEQRKQAAAQISDELKKALAEAKLNIEKFHAAQRPCHVDIEVIPGVRCVQRAVPLSRVGLYVPGGTAPLFSTVLMLAIPAKLAACGDVILCSPASVDGMIAPEVIYAADLCGVDRIFTLGGAQAIAAMAYGTETIPAVDKIFGPGNRYVTKAKQIVSGDRVAIDMPAGPSEVLVMADSSANPAFVAADMLSQAEHGADSQAILVCSSVDIAREVEVEVDKQSSLLTRGQAIAGSLSQSRAVVFDNQQQMIDFTQLYAPEHLIISMQNPWMIAENITSAGSIFVGNYSPESAGDYASGTNHTLPTSGWARSISGVGLESFMRRQTYQELTLQGLRELAPTIIAMAQAEGLDAHAQAVKIRVNQLSDET